jgi:hypothetical protein
MSPLPAITDNHWQSNTARIAFPILVEYAHRRQPITYGELDKEIVRRGLGKHLFPVLYGGPAGVIGNACAAYSSAKGTPTPPINLALVNRTTGLPGDGAGSYIQRFCRDSLGWNHVPEQLSKVDKRSIIDRAHLEIFSFPFWVEVLSAYGLKQTPKDKGERNGRWHPNPDRWHKGPESEEHKALKQLIAETPTMVHLPNQRRGDVEFRLWSGDKVDVYFSESVVAVEVKTADATADEVHRGLFQCVKYKAVLQAQQIYDGVIPTADCLLASGGPAPPQILEAAHRLKIKVVQNLHPQMRGRGTMK